MAKRQNMVDRRKVKSGQSEMELSTLVRKKLGVEIDATKMRKFVVDNFTILSIVCHEIHSAENLP